MEQTATESKVWIWILILGLILYLPAAYLRPFHSRGEPREALAAQSILTSGDWVLPERIKGDYITKPPMLHWLIALASLPSSNVSEFSSRLPSLLLGVLALSLTFLLGRSFLTREQSIIAAIILATSIVWYRTVIAARIDITLSFFVLLGLYAFFKFERSSFCDLKYMWLGSAGLALAGLTKGPAFLGLSGTIYLIYSLWQGHSLLRTLRWILIQDSIALLPLALWYWLAYQQGGDQFLQIVYQENFGRFFGSMSAGVDPHEHSFVYLLLSFIVGLAPWSLIALGLAIKPAWTKRRDLTVANIRQFLKDIPAGGSLAIVTILTSLVFFSIPDSKRAEYLLPVYPHTALLLTYFFSKQPTRQNSQVFLTIQRLLFLIVLVSAIAIPLLAKLDLQPDSSGLVFFKELLQNDFKVILGGIVLCILSLLWWHQYMKSSRGNNYLAGFSYSYLGLLAIITATILPPVTRKLSPQQVIPIIDQLPKHAPIYIMPQDYAINFYLGSRATSIEQLNTERARPVYLLAREKDMANLQLQTDRQFSSLAVNENPELKELRTFQFEKLNNLVKLWQIG